MNWFLLSYITCRTRQLTKYEGKGTSKIPIFKFSRELEKLGSATCRLFKNPNFPSLL